MVQAIPARAEVDRAFTWNVESVFSSTEEWETALERVSNQLDEADGFRGRLGESASTLLKWFSWYQEVLAKAYEVLTYASMQHDVDTSDEAGRAMNDRGQGLYAAVLGATSFAEPEILAIPQAQLAAWVDEEHGLSLYKHYFSTVEKRRPHVRSAEVEEILGLAYDPFASASGIHATLTDTDMRFRPAVNSKGEEFELAQGTIDALLHDPDREVRRTAWENYADAHLAVQNTAASCLASGVKQNVFMARARKYPSALEAALAVDQIPVEVFHNLIRTYRANLGTWHKYWRLRKETLGYESFHVYDIMAPLTRHKAHVPYHEAVEWTLEGMRPMGERYVEPMRKGVREQGWVDVYPNKGKRSGAYSGGSPTTYPFILMSYQDDLFSLSTLAHELGHSMHSYFSNETQPFIYADYSIFAAEVASNFNQATVRAHLLKHNQDVDFQIEVIEEAMANFHRYFFIMPTLARFEYESHRRAEEGEALTAQGLNTLLYDLFAEGYGDEVEKDEARIGITWAEFPVHLYLNFYVYQYATGIAGAQALADAVMSGEDGATDRYVDFLRAGSSMFPLDALRQAGVDLSRPEPVETAFAYMGELVDRLGVLLKERGVS